MFYPHHIARDCELDIRYLMELNIKTESNNNYNNDNNDTNNNDNNRNNK